MDSLTPEEERLLRELAGEATLPPPGPRICQNRVGQCTSKYHVHPSPNTQVPRVDWMLSQGYTKQEIVRKLVELDWTTGEIASAVS